MNVEYTGRHFANCNDVAPILHRLTDKWSILIIMVLLTGSRRFNEMRREITGISQRMLTRTLRILERDGLVSRKVTPTVPPRVDYSLTELGQSFKDPINSIGNWALDHAEIIWEAQRYYDETQDEIK
ncbi:MAG TPA: helix-turn-helix domain-containing protein [Sphingomicrobium sp.]|nr:helix-turn-helix domain-containing protein [Sphingomicrobium sp.]